MYCFVLHIGIYLYCTDNKETHKSCACFQHANTRSGRMVGRVCMLKASTGLVCLFTFYTIFIYIPISNTKQYIYHTKYTVLHHSRTYNNVYILSRPARSVGGALDLKSQGCEFESHSGQDFFFHFVFCRFRRAPDRSTGPMQMKSSMTSIRGI